MSWKKFFFFADQRYAPKGSAGSGHIITEDHVDFTARSHLDFDSNDFSVTDDPGNDSTDITLSAAVLADLALGASALQNVVEDLTPELGGDLDALRKTLNNAFRLYVTGKATAYGSGGVQAIEDAFIHITDDHTWNYLVSTFLGNKLILPPVVRFSGVQTIQQSMFALGGGFLFWANPTITNDSSMSPDLAGIYTLVDQANYIADTNSCNLVGAVYSLYSAPVLGIANGGTLAGSGASLRSVISAPTINSGATIGTRAALEAKDTAGTGGPTKQAGVIVNALVNGVSANVGILLGGASLPTGNYTIYQSDENIARYNGAQQQKVRTITGGRTLDYTDFIIKYTGSGANNLNLPQASTCNGRRYGIKRALGAGVPTVVRFAGDTLDLAAANHALAANEMYWITSDGGTDWMVG